MVNLAEPSAPIPPLSKWQQEFAAFQRLLPQLLTTHRGKYVAIHEGRVIGVGADRLALALEVLGRVGSVDIHVGLVTEAPIARSGVRRDLAPTGGPLRLSLPAKLLL